MSCNINRKHCPSIHVVPLTHPSKISNEERAKINKIYLQKNSDKTAFNLLIHSDQFTINRKCFGYHI